MKINKIKDTNLDLYYEKLANGLDVYIIPKNNINNIYVTLTAKFGSSILSFIPYGKDNYISVPPGVAHFLEHKVFAQEDGIDPSAVFTKNGADCNANTSNYKTTYLFSGPTKFSHNLNYLLDFVQNPYFTDINVNKEKGIIEQEIKMYDDMPFWKLFDRTKENVFVNNFLKHSVAGKVSDINKITKDILYDCYKTFYQPSNMFLVITGNVDVNKTIEIVKKNQNKKIFLPQKNITTKTIVEPDNVLKELDVIKFNVEIPKICIAYKINVLDYDINLVNLYLNTLFDIKFGSVSLLDEQLKNNHLITDTIGYEVVLAGNHILYMFLIETEKPDELINIFVNEMNNLNVFECDVTRKKKILKSIVQFRSDNIYDINHKVINNVIKFDKVILDDYEIIDSMSANKINEMVNNLNFSFRTITIMKK